ncbi:3-oxoacyl-ACP reductase [Streptomyces antibioticus]|nr:SDR family NAD(P)-dependent oxidoreductase [Streptomyces antibioticus]KUN25073.1 3-oxoacyl-ACP reductase [Streptomyces antibioticus]
MARVLITGASRGIGRGIAVALAGQGHEVIATARDVAALEDVPAALKLRLDVTDQASVDAALAASGRVDVLVSNAGTTVRAPVETVPLDAVRDLFELNTFGALRVAQGVLPQMRERGSGQLIFVSSVQGRFVIPLIGPYGASKHALEALAETIAIESGRFGISVHILEPPAVNSGGAERSSSYLDDDSPYRPLLGKLGPFRGDPVSVEEVAEAVAATIRDGAKAPLRAGVGESGVRQLAARKAAPDTVPFLVAPLEW